MAGEDKPGIMQFPEMRQEEMTMLCSAAGRVVYLSGGLKLLLEEDLTGRNLNDFVEDQTVARVISRSQPLSAPWADSGFPARPSPWRSIFGSAWSP